MSDVKWPKRAKNKSSGVTWEQLEQGDDWVAVNPGPYTEIGDRRTGDFALQMLEEGHWILDDHSQQPAPVEPPAPSQPADVPEVEVAELRERLAAAEDERDEPKASFDLEDDGTPEYGTPAYELFDKAITWTVHQLKNVLGVKEWSTSGGGTETLDGDLRMELNDLLKAAGRDDDSMETLRADLARAKDFAAWACHDYWRRGNPVVAQQIAKSFGLPDPVEHEGLAT